MRDLRNGMMWSIRINHELVEILRTLITICVFNKKFKKSRGKKLDEKTQKERKELLENIVIFVTMMTSILYEIILDSEQKLFNMSC